MKKLNLKIWLVVFTLGLLVACGNEAQGDSADKKMNHSDAEWVEKITGTWTSGKVTETVIRYNEETYFADMTTCGFFHEAGFNYDTRVGLFKTTWEVVDGMLITVIIEATSNTYLEIDEIIKDKIISVEENLMILQSIDTGSTYKRYRVKQPRHRANCKLWENFDIDADDYDEDAKVKI